jgi:8-oxo-dGTP pyrophosphatase MutT (NUDIX family)
VILLKNERDEWELPGGKLEVGEHPETSVKREIREELGLEVEPSRILDSWVYEIRPTVPVLIVTYGCVELSRAVARLSNEHREVAWFELRAVEALPMPTGYKRSVATWAASVRS